MRRFARLKGTAVLLALLMLSGCSAGTAVGSSDIASSGGSAAAASEDAGNSTTGNDTNNGTNNAEELSVDTSGMFTDRDYEIGYDESESAFITFNGTSAQCDSDAVSISGSTVTIRDEGTYIVSGTLENGMVIVEAEDTDKLQIVLSGVSISNDTSAALYIKEADKVFVTTASGTQNTLSNGGEYAAIDDNNIDGVIFSKADLTLNGAGTLTINAAAGHGIVSKDDLVVTSGSYAITAASHGLSGKDSIRIANGDFSIDSGKDGMQAENADDSSLGFLYIADGTFTITADGDGLSAGNYLQIESGEYTLTAGGGASKGSQGDSFWSSYSAADDSASMKGIKAAGNLTVNGGTFTIDSADDALHSNADLLVNGGDFQIASGDDGIHADTGVTISSGTITISESYEGIEGQTIDITGGSIDLTASDDGLNAAGGNDQSGFEGPGAGFRGRDSFSSDSSAYIHIAGGALVIDASGDGVDSNGSLTVSGGETYVSGPDNGGNGALDYASDATISGGIFVAAGASQMAQNFGSSSTQGAMMVTVSSQQAGSTVTLTDSSGETLLSWTAAKAYSSVVISCPEITQGATYMLTAGSSQTEVTMNSLVYSSSSGMGGGGWGGRR